jgi:hypothetical protein
MHTCRRSVGTLGFWFHRLNGTFSMCLPDGLRKQEGVEFGCLLMIEAGQVTRAEADRRGLFWLSMASKI